MFDFICDNFSQLKTLCFNGSQSISLSKLIHLNNLEKLQLILFLNTINISIDKNQCFKKLLSLELRNILMTPTLFENLVQMFPNIENFSFNIFNIKCEHENKIHNNFDALLNKCECFECMDKVFKCLSKLNHLNVLKIIGYNCESLKAIQNNINELTFKQLEDLKTITHSNSRNYSKLIFLLI
jgi:hypothetical protein